NFGSSSFGSGSGSSFGRRSSGFGEATGGSGGLKNTFVDPFPNRPQPPPASGLFGSSSSSSQSSGRPGPNQLIGNLVRIGVDTFLKHKG
ncbi:hypothetical protein PFISCL1PPCAC_11443, partial [Pristionchus fissidentatus]